MELISLADQLLTAAAPTVSTTVNTREERTKEAARLFKAGWLPIPGGEDKNPAVRHKPDVSGVMCTTAPKWTRQDVQENCHLFAQFPNLGILCVDLLVLDFDSREDLTDFKAAAPPEFRESAALTVYAITRKGVHVLYRRTPLCDELGLWDGKRQVTKYKLDLKTVARTEYALPAGASAGTYHTPGFLAVYPSPGKKWVRHPADVKLLDAPDALVRFLAANLASSAPAAPKPRRLEQQSAAQPKRPATPPPLGGLAAALEPLLGPAGFNLKEMACISEKDTAACRLFQLNGYEPSVLQFKTKPGVPCPLCDLAEGHSNCYWCARKEGSWYLKSLSPHCCGLLCLGALGDEAVEMAVGEAGPEAAHPSVYMEKRLRACLPQRDTILAFSIRNWVWTAHLFGPSPFTTLLGCAATEPPAVQVFVEGGKAHVMLLTSPRFLLCSFSPVFVPHRLWSRRPSGVPFLHFRCFEPMLSRALGGAVALSAYTLDVRNDVFPQGTSLAFRAKGPDDRFPLLCAVVHGTLHVCRRLPRYAGPAERVWLPVDDYTPASLAPLVASIDYGQLQSGVERHEDGRVTLEALGLKDVWPWTCCEALVTGSFEAPHASSRPPEEETADALRGRMRAALDARRLQAQVEDEEQCSNDKEVETQLAATLVTRADKRQRLITAYV